MTTIYRNYLIAKVGDVFVAQSEDDQCYMISTDQLRVHSAIDEVWGALENGREPSWFSCSTAIDLDHLAIEAESDPPRPKPAPVPPKPESRISYWMFGLTALLVAAPLSFIMDECLPKRIDTMLTVGVCSVAVAFGRQFALVMAVVSAIVYNFFVVDTDLGFSIPTISEGAFWSLNLAASYGIPALVKRRERLQAWWASRRIGRT